MVMLTQTRPDSTGDMMYVVTNTDLSPLVTCVVTNTDLRPLVHGDVYRPETTGDVCSL